MTSDRWPAENCPRAFVKCQRLETRGVAMNRRMFPQEMCGRKNKDRGSIAVLRHGVRGVDSSTIIAWHVVCC